MDLISSINSIWLWIFYKTAILHMVICISHNLYKISMDLNTFILILHDIYKQSIVHESFKALVSLDEVPRISLENEGNSSSGAKTRNSALSHSVISEWKRTANSRNSLKREENDRQNFLVEPKQEILIMCHLLKSKGNSDGINIKKFWYIFTRINS